MTDREETPEQSEPEQESEQGSKQKQKRYKLRNPLAQCQKCVDELSELAADRTAKINVRGDCLIRKADLLVELARLSAEAASDEKAAENSALKEQHAEDEATINQLRAEVAQWKQKANERLTVTVPDEHAAEIHARNLQQADLIENAAAAVRQIVNESDRLRIAAILIKRMDRACHAFEICEFASSYAFSKKKDSDLEDIISQAAPDAKGSAIQLAKATLSARGVPIPEVGSFSTRPVYRDVFDAIDSGEF